LFAALGVIQQRTVRKTEPLWFVNHIHDSATIQEPKARYFYPHRDVRSSLDWHRRPMKTQPRKREHLPGANCGLRALECQLPGSKHDVVSIHVVAGGDHSASCSQLRIRESRVSLPAKESCDLVNGWSAESNHC